MTSNLKALEQGQAGTEEEGRRTNPSEEDRSNPTTHSLQPLLSCPICMESLQDLPEGREVKVTRCGHLFCNLCLTEALKQKKVCPTCREKVSTGKITKVFL